MFRISMHNDNIPQAIYMLQSTSLHNQAEQDAKLFNNQLLPKYYSQKATVSRDLGDPDPDTAGILKFF